MRAGRWQSTVGLGLRGKTLAIFGYGKIGAVIAGYGKAFGMKVLVWGRASRHWRVRVPTVTRRRRVKTRFSKPAMSSRCILRLIDATRGIVTAADLAQMKPTALIVNTSRAGLIEAGALERALKLGRPGMAAVECV